MKGKLWCINMNFSMSIFNFWEHHLKDLICRLKKGSKNLLLWLILFTNQVSIVFNMLACKQDNTWCIWFDPEYGQVLSHYDVACSVVSENGQEKGVITTKLSGICISSTFSNFRIFFCRNAWKITFQKYLNYPILWKKLKLWINVWRLMKVFADLNIFLTHLKSLQKEFPLKLKVRH